MSDARSHARDVYQCVGCMSSHVNLACDLNVVSLSLALCVCACVCVCQLSESLEQPPDALPWHVFIDAADHDVH